MVVNRQPFFLGLLAFLGIQLSPVLADCPLDLSSSNFTLVASTCSVISERGKCCRYINAFIAISIARYANSTTNLGVTKDLSSICLDSISQTMELYGVPRNAMSFCGVGTKVPVNYNCKGRTTTVQMLRSPTFSKVARNCEVPFSEENSCSKCLNSGITYVRNLVGEESNVTLNTCRDAAYAAIASRFDNESSIELASCFFQIPELHNNIPDLESSPSSLTPLASPSPSFSTSPSNDAFGNDVSKVHPSFHLTVIHAVGIAVTAIALTMLIVLVVLIHRKSRELEDSENMDKNPSKTFSSPHPVLKFHEGNSPAFRRFSYKETKKATNNFSIEIGCGGFGTVYRAEFSDGAMAAVKRMNKISKQGEEEFCREIELLARLHHRHLVALKGFCVKKNERFLLYEFMSNGSLKDHLHSARTPLDWGTRIQIAIDVANALEYLHFYCDPPLCHRDIKSSNILLDENFVAKVADFGLAHASSDGSIGFPPVNTDIRGTPGYMDPEYVVTHELTEKSDVYSYGVVLLEMITAKRAVEDGKNLVESCQPLLSSSESRSTDLVDPRIKHSFNFEQLQTLITVIRWCTQKEGELRPSIKQVLRLLYESSDPLHSGFARAVEDDLGRSGSKGKMQRVESGFHSGDAACLASSSSTSRSHCSRSFLLETGSSQSPPNALSF